MANHIFRKSSQVRLYSPDQLDKLLVIIRPKGWIALITLLILIVGALVWAAFAKIPVQISVKGVLNSPEGFFTIKALEEGSVVDIKVKKGDFVTVNQPLVVLFNAQNAHTVEKIPFKLLKKEEAALTVTSPVSGTVFRVDVNLEDYLRKGMPLLTMSRAEGPNEQVEAYGYLPIHLKNRIKEGMPVQIDISGKTFKGKIKSVSRYSLSSAEILQRVLSKKWLLYLNPSDEPTLEMAVTFDDGEKEKGLLVPGTLCLMRVTIDEKKPLRFLFP